MKRQAPLIDFYRHQRIDPNSIDPNSLEKMGSPPWAQDPWRQERRWTQRISPWWQIHLRGFTDTVIPCFVFGLQDRFLRLIPIDASQQRALKSGDACEGKLLIHQEKTLLKGSYQRLDAWSSSLVLEPASREILRERFDPILNPKRVSKASREMENTGLWANEEKEYVFPLGVTLRFSKRKAWIRVSFAGFFFEWIHSSGIATGRLIPRSLPEQVLSHFELECGATYDSRPHAQWSHFVYSVIENAHLNGHDRDWLMDRLKPWMFSEKQIR